MDHGVIAVLVAAIMSAFTFGMAWVFKKGKNIGEQNIINKQNEEQANLVRQNKKIEDYANSLDDITVTQQLQDQFGRKD